MLHFLPNYSDDTGTAGTQERVARPSVELILGGPMLPSRSHRALVHAIQVALAAILALFIAFPAYAAGDEKISAAPPVQGSATGKQDEQQSNRCDAAKLS